MGCWKNFKTKLLHLICEMFIQHLVSLCEYNNSSCCVKLNLLTAWAAEVRCGRGGIELNCCSVKAVNEVQSARWMFV